MADENQVKILRRGVGVWNAWRDEHLTAEVSFQGFVFALAGADDPFDSYLEGVNFEDVNLRNVVLRNAFLKRALLGGADARSADFSYSEFAEADMRGVILVGANLTGVGLQGVNVCNAVFGDTVISRADLSGVIGLGRTVHRFPSIVDSYTIDTTARSIAGRPEKAGDVVKFFLSAGVERSILKTAFPNV